MNTVKAADDLGSLRQCKINRTGRDVSSHVSKMTSVLEK